MMDHHFPTFALSPLSVMTLLAEEREEREEREDPFFIGHCLLSLFRRSNRPLIDSGAREREGLSQKGGIERRAHPCAVECNLRSRERTSYIYCTGFDGLSPFSLFTLRFRPCLVRRSVYGFIAAVVVTNKMRMLLSFVRWPATQYSKLD